MSDLDRTAIEIVKNLQTNIRRTTLAMVAIFAVAILTAVFWGGGINNQVKTNAETGKTNSQDIKDLTKAINDYFMEQRVANTGYVTKEELGTAKDYWDATKDNLEQIEFWARSRGFNGKFRSAASDTNRN